MCYEAEWVLVAGAVDKIVTSWMGIGLPWGLSRILRALRRVGHAWRFEEWSHLGLGLRFRAAAMGMPFLPALTMLGSDLMGVGGLKTIACPFTGETLAAVPALFPDVALLHVHRADRFGNCQIDGYPHMDADIARAATTVLVTAEEIVPTTRSARQPDRTVIPGFAGRRRSSQVAVRRLSRTSATASTRPTSTTSTSTSRRSTSSGADGVARLPRAVRLRARDVTRTTWTCSAASALERAQRRARASWCR